MFVVLLLSFSLSVCVCVCVQVSEEEWRRRTDVHSVPPDALKLPTHLLTSEVRHTHLTVYMYSIYIIIYMYAVLYVTVCFACSQCLKFYTSEWHRVTYNYSKFSSSFSTVIR